MSYQITQTAPLTAEYPFVLTIILDGCVSAYECKDRHEAKVLWLQIRESMCEA